MNPAHNANCRATPEPRHSLLQCCCKGARNHVIDKLSFWTDGRWCTHYSW